MENKMLVKFKENKLEQSMVVVGGRRVREYHDFDGDGKWDMKRVVVLDRNGNLQRIIYKYR